MQDYGVETERPLSLIPDPIDIEHLPKGTEALCNRLQPQTITSMISFKFVSLIVGCFSPRLKDALGAVESVAVSKRCKPR
jgi:hypothetical protein